jgi:transcription termination factor Rho
VLVSVDSTELQRATLERKDREELMTIAVAVGAKPNSRTKKADLIDMILGAGSSRRGGNGAAEGGPTADAEAATETQSDAPAPAAEREPVAEPAAAKAAATQTATAERADTQPAAEPAAPAPSVAPPAALDEQGSASDDGEAAATSVARRRPAARLVGWAGDDTRARRAAPAKDTQRETSREASRDASREAAVERSLFDDAAARATDASVPAESRPSEVAADRAERERDNGSRGADEADRGEASERSETDRGDGDHGDGEQGDRYGEGESANRRRRRRGRERNRDERGERPQEEAQIEPVPVAGYLDLRDEGYGFLRINGYLPSRDDAYVSVRQARQFGLRKGDYITGASRPAGRNEKNPALLRIDSVNGADPESVRQRPRFEDLTPLFPDEKLRLELRDDPGNMTARIIDLIAPIGKGQRGLIVSPPKAGKTTIMKQIARSIEQNNPEVHLIVLLVDERPEEVTDMRRWLLKGEVAASTFDRPADEHIQVAELTIERAKRMVEAGKDVVIILDGITRLARAYNLGAPPTGRIMSGGIDTGALYPPKKFFGAARNVEEGGSLTILATALVETGSRMDEVIFEEFKGTGNMELRLDRRMAERRIFPAIDVDASSTRHEELLFDRKQLQQVWKLRRVLSGLASDGDGGAAAGLELLIDRLKSFRNNDEFLAEVAKGTTA